MVDDIDDSRQRDGLLAIARIVGAAMDLTEALRLICRELAHLTGAETVGAHLLDRERDELRPVAGYHVPKHALDGLTAGPVAGAPFWPEVVKAGELVWSDDVPHDERFAFPLFRAVAHQSGVVIPLVVDGETAGTFYLVWRTERRRVEPDEAAMLQTIGRQAGLLLRNARLSDLQRAEEALRQRETQLRNLGDNLPGGVIYQVVRRLDGSNYFPYMSSGLERTFGVRASQAMTDASVVYRLVLPEDLARIRAAADESIRTGGPMDVEYRMLTPAGEIRWLNLRARPNRLADGATQWDVVALDVTDRKHAEEAVRERETRLQMLADRLRRSEERYRLLFERSFVGMFRTRSDGTLVECNDAFARILGYGSAADVRGRSVLGHYATPADRDAVVARLAGGEDVIEVELTGRRRDGSPVPVAMSVRRIADPDGPIHEGILLDVTDRRRAEEATALRSVAALAHAAAHEINNPLTVISGQLELIHRGRGTAERIARVQAAVGRIRDIVNHMTQITRLEASDRWSADLPLMLDIRRSGTQGEEAEPGSNDPGV